MQASRSMISWSCTRYSNLSPRTYVCNNYDTTSRNLAIIHHKKIKQPHDTKTNKGYFVHFGICWSFHHPSWGLNWLHHHNLSVLALQLILLCLYHCESLIQMLNLLKTASKLAMLIVASLRNLSKTRHPLHPSRFTRLTKRPLLQVFYMCLLITMEGFLHLVHGLHLHRQLWPAAFFMR